MKPRILFINSVCGFGSTGRIVADLSKSEDYDSLICYGRKKDFANVNSYKFANFFDNAFGALGTILFDNNIKICSLATKRLIKKIEEFNPDIIHIHNLHGYYVNVVMLFDYLKKNNKPVIWTFHDCWPITGYCALSQYINCQKYSVKCENCPSGFSYPFSLFKQRVTKEFEIKKDIFNSLDNLTIVTPSKWLKGVIKNSFLSSQKIAVVNNGIDLTKFKKVCEKNKKFTCLAIANIWTKYRGIDELKKIAKLLDKDIDLVVVGSQSDQVAGAKSIEHTNSIEELVKLYSSSHVLLNPTLEDNFPTINIESLACGTPVITYRTGGSPEIIDDKTGIVVEKKEVESFARTINGLKNNYYFLSKDCIDRSKNFSKDNMIIGYRKIYESLLGK